MTDNERDTKFLGFAQLLWPEIAVKLAQLDFEQATRQDAHKMDTEIYTLIAQRAYDLACHVMYKTLRGCSLRQIPDIHDWSITEDRKFDVEDVGELKEQWPKIELTPELCSSCLTFPRQPGSTLCSTCQQEQDDELQDHYDSHYT